MYSTLGSQFLYCPLYLFFSKSNGFSWKDWERPTIENHTRFAFFWKMCIDILIIERARWTWISWLPGQFLSGGSLNIRHCVIWVTHLWCLFWEKGLMAVVSKIGRSSRARSDGTTAFPMKKLWKLADLVGSWIFLGFIAIHWTLWYKKWFCESSFLWISIKSF